MCQKERPRGVVGGIAPQGSAESTSRRPAGGRNDRGRQIRSEKWVVQWMEDRSLRRSAQAC